MHLDAFLMLVVFGLWCGPDAVEVLTLFAGICGAAHDVLHSATMCYPISSNIHWVPDEFQMNSRWIPFTMDWFFPSHICSCFDQVWGPQWCCPGHGRRWLGRSMTSKMTGMFTGKMWRSFMKKHGKTHEFGCIQIQFYRDVNLESVGSARMEVYPWDG